MATRWPLETQTVVLAFDDGVKPDGLSLAWTESKCFLRASGLPQLAMHIGHTNPYKHSSVLCTNYCTQTEHNIKCEYKEHVTKLHAGYAKNEQQCLGKWSQLNTWFYETSLTQPASVESKRSSLSYNNALLTFTTHSISIWELFILLYMTTTTVLRPFFQDHPGEPVTEENFWTLWCKGRLTEADTQTISPGATPSRLTSAHLHHPPPIFYRLNALPVTQPTLSKHRRQLAHLD